MNYVLKSGCEGGGVDKCIRKLKREIDKIQDGKDSGNTNDGKSKRSSSSRISFIRRLSFSSTDKINSDSVPNSQNVQVGTQTGAIFQHGCSLQDNTVSAPCHNSPSIRVRDCPSFH